MGPRLRNSWKPQAFAVASAVVDLLSESCKTDSRFSPWISQIPPLLWWGKGRVATVKHTQGFSITKTFSSGERMSPDVHTETLFYLRKGNFFPFSSLQLSCLTEGWCQREKDFKETDWGHWSQRRCWWCSV